MTADSNRIPATRLPSGAQTSCSSGAEIRHLNQYQLARRWGISERTLERWRWLRRGVNFVKIGGHVAYRLADVEAYERNNVRCSAENNPPPSSQSSRS
jgi:hypothetical protein